MCVSRRRSCRRFYFLQKGHGLSGHKSVDGPPQLLAEYAYYVAELVEALGWGGGGHGGGDGADGGSVSASTGGGKVGGKKTNDDDDDDDDEEEEGSGRPKTTTSSASHDDDDDDDENDAAAGGENGKIILVGHSMGSGVSVVLTASFPEWFSALVLLEGGLVARDAGDASRHVRAACQRRLRSNRTLFPNAGGGGLPAAPPPPRARVYGNLDAAIRARLSTTERMPGDQSLSYEAARDMVVRATVPATATIVAGNSTPSGVTVGGDGGGGGPVVFRHDPRLQWPSLQYYTREQVGAFMADVRSSGVPVCFLWAADGWPVDAWAEGAVRDVLRPGRLRRLGGSHHFHADPDTVGPVAAEVVAFLTERGL